MSAPAENPRCVWAVETWMRSNRRWFVMDVRVLRSAAWALARQDRQRWPDEKFRVVKYVSTKP